MWILLYLDDVYRVGNLSHRNNHPGKCNNPTEGEELASFFRSGFSGWETFLLW